MKNKKKFILTSFCVIILVSFFSVQVPTNYIYAAVPPTTTASESTTTLIKEKPGWVETIFTKFLVSIGDSMQEMLSDVGIGLDQMLLGKDNIGNESAFLFSFKDNNIFGDVAKSVYVICLQIAMVAFIIIFPTIGIRVMAAPNKSKALEQIKSLMGTYIIAFFLLYLMPVFIDVLMQVRDAIVAGIVDGMSKGSSSASANNNSIFQQLRSAAIIEGESGLFDGFLYLGINLITVWFAFAYASISMAITALVSVFPLMAITMNSAKTRKSFENWLGEIISLCTVPIIDALLMAVAVNTLNSPNASPLTTMIIMALIIPTRTLIRKVIGIGGGMEASGIGFLMGGVALAGGIAKTAGSTMGGLKDGVGDLRRASYYNDMARVDKLAMSGAGGAGALGNSLGTSSGINAMASSVASTPVNYASNLSKVANEVGATMGAGPYGTSLNPMSTRTTTASKTSGAGLANEVASKFGKPTNYADVYQKHKSLSWLDSTEMMNNLSNEDKAKMHTRRGLQSIGKAVGGAAGAGYIGAGFTTAASWIGASGMMSAGGLGLNVGNAVGGELGGLAGNGAYYTGHVGAEFLKALLNRSRNSATGASPGNTTSGSSPVNPIAPVSGTGVGGVSSSAYNSAAEENTVFTGDIVDERNFTASLSAPQMGLPTSPSIDMPEVQQIIQITNFDSKVNEDAHNAGVNASSEYVKNKKMDYINNGMNAYKERMGYDMDTNSMDYKVLQSEAVDFTLSKDIQLNSMNEYLKANASVRSSAVKDSLSEKFGTIAGTTLEKEIDDASKNAVEHMMNNIGK